MTVASGTRLGPYTIRAELGHGGMGIVYRSSWRSRTSMTYNERRPISGR